MLFWDALIRFSTLAALLLFAAFALRDARAVPSAKWGVALAVSMAALMISTSQAPMTPPMWLFAPARIIDTVSIVLVWIFGRAVFEDEFRAGWLEWGVLAVYGVTTLPFRLVDFGVLDYSAGFFRWIDLVQDAMAVAMFAHLVFIALRGREDDLVEARRRARFVFVLLAAVAMIVSVFAENLFNTVYPGAVSLLRAVLALGATLWGLFWVMRLSPALLRFEPVPADAPETDPAVEPRDAAVHARLLATMEDGIHAEPGLTIGALAGKIGVPEHQLRALINRAMGYRNFSAFLNAYRVAAAKTALADPEQARTPILTIAMDTGFGSLAPFNRAFKATEGVTPTQFRKAALRQSDQS